MIQEMRCLWLPLSTWPETECGVEARQLTRRNQALTKGSWLASRGPLHLFYSHGGKRSLRNKAIFPPPPSISTRPRDPKIPKEDDRRKKTATANETSHMANTQQLAGPTNEL